MKVGFPNAKRFALWALDKLIRPTKEKALKYHKLQQEHGVDLGWKFLIWIKNLNLKKYVRFENGISVELKYEVGEQPDVVIAFDIQILKCLLEGCDADGDYYDTIIALHRGDIEITPKDEFEPIEGYLLEFNEHFNELREEFYNALYGTE